MVATSAGHSFSAEQIIQASSSRSLVPSSTTKATSITVSSVITTSTSTTAPPVNTSPFFPEPSTLHPPPDSDQWSRNLVKNVLTYLVVIGAVLVALFLAFRRFSHLKRTSQPLARFFPWPRHPQRAPCPSSPSPSHQTQTWPYHRTRSRPAEFAHYVLPSESRNSPEPAFSYTIDDDIRYPITIASLHPLRSPPQLAFPANTYSGSCPDAAYPYLYPSHTSMQHRSRTRIRAVDTDEHGRRLGSGWDPDNFDFEGVSRQNEEDTDVLPAYDRFGGPPKYVDVEMGVQTVRDLENGGDCASSRQEDRGLRNPEPPDSSHPVGDNT